MATASTSLPQPSPLRAILAQGVAIPAAILAMLSMVVLPLPPLVLMLAPVPVPVALMLNAVGSPSKSLEPPVLIIVTF